MKKRLRRIQRFVDKNKKFTLREAIDFFVVKYRYISFLRFNETIDLAIKLNVIYKKCDQNIGSFISLPHNTGKKITIAAIVNKYDHENAIKAGADFIGCDDLIERIINRKINFDCCVTTPNLIPKIAVIAKILGPKGLMPTVKRGTVSSDLYNMIRVLKSGCISFNIDENLIIKTNIAKISLGKEKIIQNIIAVLDFIKAIKVNKGKGTFIEDICISITQGPSIKVDLKSVMV